MMYGRMMNSEFAQGCRGLGAFHGPVGMIIWTLLILGIIYLIYKIITKDNTSQNHILESLQMKYVSGEIDEEEYEKKIRVLKRK